MYVTDQEPGLTAVERPLTLRLALPPGAQASGRARAALSSAGLPEELEHSVTLLASELVANSVKHSGAGQHQRIVLLADLSEDFARVEVYDSGAGFDPEVRHTSGGFGLRLVDKIATRWGTQQGDGFMVWFEVQRSPRFKRA